MIDFDSQQYNTTASLRAGITWHFTDIIQMHGDLGYTTDLTDYQFYRADLGFRLMW